jgi:hypothetical protein
VSRYPLRKFQGVPLGEPVTPVGNNDIKDLRRLIELVDPDTFTAHELCILNPTFGDASRMVGGADTDVLLDDTLRDVKTVKDFDLKSPYFNQIG